MEATRGWKAMEDRNISMADRIKALEHEYLQYNDKVNLTAEHSLKGTRNLEQKIEADIAALAIAVEDSISLAMGEAAKTPTPPPWLVILLLLMGLSTWRL